ncbi:unnamed protein product [Tetraodon nigroviridis]|uniref:(spotted green pufferfish) hypothetical protein n=1 Tax=Tetraodon nigroviridis TaxID=99883 RepID=Q4RLQ0_TETNG|nr:unnamed protein product [Tetraodon nigroviridis]
MAPFPRSKPGAPASSAQTPRRARGSCQLCPRCDHSFLGNTATGPGSPELARRSSKLCPPRGCSEPAQGSFQLCPGATTLSLGNTATGPRVPRASPPLQQALPARQRSRLGRIGPEAGLLGAIPGLMPALPRCDHSSLWKHSHRPGSPERARGSCHLCPGASNLPWETQPPAGGPRS